MSNIWNAKFNAAAARITELEAEAASHREIEEMVLRAKVARIAELEVERDNWRQAAGDLFSSGHADNVELVKLEAERDHAKSELVKWRQSAIDQQRRRKLAEAERDKWRSDAITQMRRAIELEAEIVRLTNPQ